MVAYTVHVEQIKVHDTLELQYYHKHVVDLSLLFLCVIGHICIVVCAIHSKWKKVKTKKDHTEGP